MLRLPIPACLIALAITLNGCRDADPLGLVPVTGVVIYDNQPVANAQVVFMPEQGLPAVGQTDLDGKFTLSTGDQPGASPGTNQVSVTAFQWIRPVTRGEMEGLPREELAKLQKWPIPQKYGSAATSELVIQIRRGEANEIRLDLK